MSVLSTPIYETINTLSTESKSVLLTFLDFPDVTSQAEQVKDEALQPVAKVKKKKPLRKSIASEGKCNKQKQRKWKVKNDSTGTGSDESLKIGDKDANSQPIHSKVIKKDPGSCLLCKGVKFNTFAVSIYLCLIVFLTLVLYEATIQYVSRKSTA